MPAAPDPPALRFERFELQPGERRLLVDGQPAAVGSRAFDLLLVLATQPQHLVSKNELLDRVWPGLVVEESNLHVQISGLRKLLGGELIATIPGRGYRLNVQPLAGTAKVAAAAAAGGAPASGTPAAGAAAAGTAAAGARLIGRGEDLAQLGAALAEPGCVTLVGAAGVGKTRLAQALAARWSGPLHWVDLAALADAAQVPGALARALQLPLPEGDATAVLARALRQEGLLLVLDNAEHLIAAVADAVDRLLQAAPGSRWLVTSQLPLAIAPERVHRLEPLALPGTLDDEQALADGALALLVDRIVAVQRQFRVDAQSLPLLRALCTRLDGLPLALEMAATRVPTLGLAGVCDALGERFSLLTAGHRTAARRHRTLHAALDWSHGLLAPAEQRLFRSLGVFAGGFTIELALAAAGTEGGDRWATIDRLATLVDRSLVAAGPQALPRYHLLDTLRAYALEQLAAAGEEDAVRGRVAHALLERFRSVTTLSPPDEKACCLAELDNLREALDWARRHAPVLAIELSLLAPRLTAFSLWRNEALAWLFACEPLLVAPLTDQLDPALHASWWGALARGLIFRLSPRAADAARRACALARQPGLEKLLHAALVALVRSIPQPGAELDAAQAELQALGAAHEEDWPLSMHLSAQGAYAVAYKCRGDHARALEARQFEVLLARRCGMHDAAEAAQSNVIAALTELERHEEALQAAREQVRRLRGSDSPNAPWAWDMLLTNLIALGQLDEAAAEVGTGMAACRRSDLPPLAGNEALLAALRGRPRDAARLAGHARQAFALRGIPLAEGARDSLARVERLARPLLGDALFEQLVEQGRQLGDEAAQAVAERACDAD